MHYINMAPDGPPAKAAWRQPVARTIVALGLINAAGFGGAFVWATWPVSGAVIGLTGGVCALIWACDELNP